jgi:DNA-binding transcriptional MerR regulator
MIYTLSFISTLIASESSEVVMGSEYRLDDLARSAGVASTTVRLYQQKGLLAPPRLEGRTGWYDDAHLSRLRLIARLQDEGHSLAGIADLLDQWERGRSLDAVIGVEAQLDLLIGEVHAVDLDPADLLGRFPEGAMTPELMQRAAALNLVTPTEGGRLRITDRRFLETGAALAQLGLPLDLILDEWELLVAHTDDIAGRFVDIFEDRLLPPDWEEGLAAAQAEQLTATLAQLHAAARQVLAAALDASLARIGRDRLAALIEP